MSTCGKCGDENLAGAKFCQMCANPLAAEATGEAPAKKLGSSLSTIVVVSIEPPEQQICPVCDAANEGEWVFCQQCGSKLGSSPLGPTGDEKAPAPKQKPTFATTIQASQLVDKLKNARPGIACPRCSQPLVAGAAFCHKCGAVISNARTIAMSSLKPSTKARLLLMVDGEATGDAFEIKGDTVIGRVDGDITFPHDDYMSGRHASIAKRGEKFVLIDEDSRNGSFMRIKKEVELEPGDFILLGKQLFRFEL